MRNQKQVKTQECSSKDQTLKREKKIVLSKFSPFLNQELSYKFFDPPNLLKLKEVQSSQKRLGMLKEEKRKLEMSHFNSFI